MSELVDWLSAQLDADEAVARGVRTQRWDEIGFHDQARDDIPHIVNWSPARVLVEVEAKRAIVARFEQAVRLCEANTRASVDSMSKGLEAQEQTYALRRHGYELQGRRDGLEFAVRLLALPYADRPGFDETWRP